MPRPASPDRIRKLRALARDQAGTPEGDAAARLARRLTLQHARDQATRRYRGLPDADPIAKRKLPFDGPERWRRRLAAATARHVGCVAAWPRGKDHAWLFGHRSAIEVGDYLYDVLRREVDAACLTWIAREAPMLTLEEAEADPADLRRRSSFCQSAVAAIDARLRELRDGEDGRDPTGTALVLDRRRAVDDWLADRGIDLSPPAERPWRYSADGYLAGYRIPLLDAVRDQQADGR
jgi:hypothetical protein